MKYLSFLLVALSVTGCASITTGNSQVISVETRDKGQMVSGAMCTMTNPKGTYYITSPGTVTIRRAYDDLNVKCEKEGLQPGLLTVKSTTKAMAFGNILFGGIIGGAIDAGSGAAYDYPPLVSVQMGESGIANPPPANATSPAKASVAESESSNTVGVRTKDYRSYKGNGPPDEWMINK